MEEATASSLRFEYKDGSTTYVVEALANARGNLRGLSYVNSIRSGLLHQLDIRPVGYSGLGDIVCRSGSGHSFAEGFDLATWDMLKDAYSAGDPTQ